MSDGKKAKKTEKVSSTVDKVALAWTIIMSIVGVATAGVLVAIGVKILLWLQGG